MFSWNILFYLNILNKENFYSKPFKMSKILVSVHIREMDKRVNVNKLVAWIYAFQEYTVLFKYI